MSLIIFFIIVLIYMVLDDKVTNDEIKSNSQIPWTKEDAIKYYDQEYYDHEKNN
jgi:hypothetical protein